MHFIDQGWRQVDLMRPCPSKSTDDTLVADTRLMVSTGPSLHAFTPRLRVLVQCARIRKRMRLSTVATTINVSADLLRDIEEGVRFPSSRVLEALQSVLGVHLMPEAANGAMH